MNYVSAAELRRRADVVEHVEKGGKVEMSLLCVKGAGWVRLDGPPSWSWDEYEYRPYVEPPKPAEVWLWVYETGSLAGGVWNSEKNCALQNRRASSGRAVLFREVTP